MANRFEGKYKAVSSTQQLFPSYTWRLVCFSVFILVMLSDWDRRSRGPIEERGSQSGRDVRQKVSLWPFNQSLGSEIWGSRASFICSQSSLLCSSGCGRVGLLIRGSGTHAGQWAEDRQPDLAQNDAKNDEEKTRDVLLQVRCEGGGQICRSSAWFHRKTIEKQCSWVMFCGSMYESRAQESVLLWPWIRRKNDPQWNEIHKQRFLSFCQYLIC